MDMYGGEAATSPSCARGGVSSRQKPLRFLWVALGRLLSLLKGGQGNQGKKDWNTSKAGPEALQVEQAHGFRLGLEVEKRGDLPRAGSAHLLPLAATLPGSWQRTHPCSSPL